MLKNLTPQFLKALDGWLLKNWPLVWRTRIHWVLLFSLVGHLLVAVGFGLYPLSMEDLPDFYSRAFVYQLLIGVTSISFLVWGYFTTKIPIRSYRLRDFLLTAFLYGFGVFCISSNVWVTSKMPDRKISALAGDIKDVSNDDIKILEIARYEVWQKVEYLKKYKAIPTDLSFDHSNSEKETNEFLLSAYKKSLRGMMIEAENRAYSIRDAKHAQDWFYYDHGRISRDLFVFLLLSLLFIPLLYTFWSMTGFKEILVTAFALFVTLIGLGMITNGHSFEETLVYFTILVVFLVALVQVNYSKSNWLTVYGTALVALNFVVNIEFDYGGCIAPYGKYLIYESLEIFYPLVTLFSVGLGGYLYCRRTKLPQIN